MRVAEGSALRGAGPPFRIVLLLSLLLVADATVLFAHFGRAYAGPDAAGYFVQARLLATEGAAAWPGFWTLPDTLRIYAFERR